MPTWQTGDLQSALFSEMLSHNDDQLFPVGNAPSWGFGSSEMERSQLMEPNLPVCTVKLQHCQNHLRARVKHLCTKSPYRKSSNGFFFPQRKAFLEERFQIQVFSLFPVEKQVHTLIPQRILKPLLHSDTAQFYLHLLYFQLLQSF